MDYKVGHAKFNGRTFEVRFSQYSDEYFELHTKTELDRAARSHIEMIVCQVAETEYKSALVTIETA